MVTLLLDDVRPALKGVPMTLTAGQIGPMQVGASQIDDCNGTFKGVRTAVEGTMAGSVSSYNTPAAAVLRQAMADWDIRLGKITAQFDEISAALRANANTYQGSVQDDTTSANAVMAALGGGYTT
jgi:hypothetical protein